MNPSLKTLVFFLLILLLTPPCLAGRAMPRGPATEAAPRAGGSQEPPDEWSKPFRPGLRGITELGWFGIGGGNYEELKLGLSLGYQFNQYFLAGLGSGARISLEEDDKLTVPLFAFLRVSSLERKVSPYFAMGIGNFFDWDQEPVKEGLFLSSTLGARLNLGSRTALYLGLGIEIQNERWTSNNSAGVNLGFVF